MDHNIPEASVIIVSFNTREVLRKCLTSLKTATGKHKIEIIVVDNASKDQSAEMVKTDFPNVRLLHSKTNLGFAAANNWAFTVATGRYWILLNPDAEMQYDALDHAFRFMLDHPRAAMAGAKLTAPDGTTQPSARQFPSLLNEILVLSGMAAKFPHSKFFGRFDRTWANENTPAQVDWVPGAFAIMRPEAIKQVGHFDERFFLYYEEVDLCRRLKDRKWQIWYQPNIVIQHIGGESSKTVEKAEISTSGSQLVLWRMRSALLYYRKHHGWFSTWMLSKIETVWHSLRKMKNQAGSNKAAESQRTITLMDKAWNDTHGGQNSPPRPW